MADLDRVKISEMAPEEAAEYIRDRSWGVRFPVQPMTLVSDLGIAVMEMDLGAGRAGILSFEPKTVRLDFRLPRPLRHLACAQLLGHYLLLVGDETAQLVLKQDQLLGAEDVADPDQAFARAFAAQLLVPQNELQRLAKDRLSPEQLAIRFGVPPELTANVAAALISLG